MNISREQWTKLLYAAIVFVLMVATVFGYDAGVIQPREGALAIGKISSQAALGTTVESLIVTKQLKSFASTNSLSGDLTVGGNITTSGSISYTGAYTPNLSITGDLTVTGATKLDGGLTMDTNKFTVADTSGNTAIAGTLDVGGGFGSTGCSVSAAGVLQCDGAATIGGAATITGATALNGGLTMDTNKFTVADTTGNTVIAGTLQYLRPVLLKTANYTLTVVESGVYLANYGASASITVTLPSAEAGAHYCVGVGAAYTMTIKPGTSDYILGLTNAADDRVQNTGTVGDSVCLIAIDAVRWMPVGQARGTWSDINH